MARKDGAAVNVEEIKDEAEKVEAEVKEAAGRVKKQASKAAERAKAELEEAGEEIERVSEKVENAFNLFVEHQRNAFTEVSRAFAALLPERTREHGEKAVREVIEGYRTLFNNALDDLIKTLEKARIEENPIDRRN